MQKLSSFAATFILKKEPGWHNIINKSLLCSSQEGEKPFLQCLLKRAKDNASKKLLKIYYLAAFTRLNTKIPVHKIIFKSTTILNFSYAIQLNKNLKPHTKSLEKD